MLKSVIRASFASELVENFGANKSDIRVVHSGVAEGFLSSINILGFDVTSAVQDCCVLSVAELTADAEMTLNLDGGRRSIIEAVSGKMAKGALYSINKMRARGLRVGFSFEFTPQVANDSAAYQAIMTRFKLVPAPGPNNANSRALRREWTITHPDLALSLSHWSAR
jgi:hypothetical protein